MKTAALFTSLIAGAAAFAPSKNAAKTSTAVNMAFEEELGAQPPLGFWDPLGLVSDCKEDRFNRLRYVEIKHGRISMLAVVGYLVTASGARWGGTCTLDGTKFADIPGGFGALDAYPTAGINQIIALIGFCELFFMKDLGEGEFPGDFRNGWIDYGWDKFFDEEEKLKKRAIELNQGRAAMMGILALMVHEKLGVSLLPGGV